MFRGITGTELEFDYHEIEIEKASRMGGLVHDAFKITLMKSGDNENDNPHSYLFTTILKDRKLVFDKIQDAIVEAKTHPVKKVFKKKEPPFQLPPDEIMEKMSVIGKERLKGVSMQVRSH